MQPGPPFPAYPRPAAERERERRPCRGLPTALLWDICGSGSPHRIQQRTGQIRSSSFVQSRSSGPWQAVSLQRSLSIPFFYRWLVKKSPRAPVARAWCSESDISVFSCVVQDKILLGLSPSFLTYRPQIVSALRDQTNQLLMNLETHHLTINVFSRNYFTGSKLIGIEVTCPGRHKTRGLVQRLGDYGFQHPVG